MSAVPLTPSVVVDEASMTYRVLSAEAVQPRRGLRGRVRAARGVRTTEVQALQPLSFVVGRGESVGVIGTNGSGKSTLMKLITGQMRPTTGHIYATSTPVMLGVNAALVRQVSGEDNIRLGCLAMGMSRAEAEAKRDAVVALSGLDDHALQLPLKAYSSGMAARLQFAIATAVDPDILVIDEAYAEYVGEPDWETALPLARDAANVVVTRTFSKIYGLGGLLVPFAGIKLIDNAAFRDRMLKALYKKAQGPLHSF